MSIHIPPDEVTLRWVELDNGDLPGAPSHALVVEWPSPQGLFRTVHFDVSPTSDLQDPLFHRAAAALLERDYLKALELRGIRAEGGAAQSCRWCERLATLAIRSGLEWHPACNQCSEWWAPARHGDLSEVATGYVSPEREQEHDELTQAHRLLGCLAVVAPVGTFEKAYALMRRRDATEEQS